MRQICGKCLSELFIIGLVGMVFKTVHRIAKEFLKLSISHKEKVTAICWVLLQSELIVLNFLAEGYL